MYRYVDRLGHFDKNMIMNYIEIKRPYHHSGTITHKVYTTNSGKMCRNVVIECPVL